MLPPAAAGEDVTGLGTVEARAAAVRARLAGQRLLLVADDVWDADLARLLKDLTPAAALLTTRQHDVVRAFAPAANTRLQRLDLAACVRLLQALITVPMPEGELARAAAADGLPLTLTLLAPLLDDEAALGLGLTAFLTQVARQDWRGRALEQLGAIVDKSVAALPEADRAAFVQLAVFGARPHSPSPPSPPCGRPTNPRPASGSSGW